MPGKREYVMRLAEGKFQDVNFDADWFRGNGENVEYIAAAGAPNAIIKKMEGWKASGVRYVTGLNTNVVPIATQDSNIHLNPCPLLHPRTAMYTMALCAG